MRGELEGKLVIAPWFAFFDKNGLGHCQPDQLLIQETVVYCFECKLTQTKTAHTQLKQLYLPILREYFKLPIVLIQVCKGLRVQIKDSERITHPYQTQVSTKRVYTWHELR